MVADASAKVTFPLARPSILAVLLLSFIRALESFEVPLLIGIPGGVQTVTTALYQTVHSGFMPRYGEASAYAVLLVIAVALPLAWYYRATREAAKFATVTGKGFRPARIDLGLWKYPCAAVGADHPAVARGAAPHHAVGVVPAALFRPVAGRLRPHDARQLSGGVDARGHACRHLPTASWSAPAAPARSRRRAC